MQKKYAQFNDKNIEERSKEVINRLKKIYLLSKDLVEKKYNNLEILFELKKQLIKAFGENSVYVSALEEKGLNQFITYIYKNGSLPGSEVEKNQKDVATECVIRGLCISDNTMITKSPKTIRTQLKIRIFPHKSNEKSPFAYRNTLV